MDKDTKVLERDQPIKEFLHDGNEDPQTLPQLEPGHSSEELDPTGETLDTRH